MQAVRILFFIGMVLIPFDGVKGFSPLGELKSELCVFPFILAMLLFAALYVVREAFPVNRQVPVSGPTSNTVLLPISAGIVGVIAISGFANIPDIMTNYFHERGGLSKYVTSFLVIIYGLLLSHFVGKLVQRRWQSLIILPITISALPSCGYGAFEFMSDHGILTAIYNKIDPIIHANALNVTLMWNGKVNMKVTETWDPRLKAFCFEPPAFGDYAGFAWPWVYAGVISSKGKWQAFYKFVLFAFTVLLVAARARTGWLMLGGNCIVWLFLKFIYLRTDGRRPYVKEHQAVTFALLGALTAGVVLYAASFSTFVRRVIEGGNVSNLTRLASQTSAFNMFLSRPIFGVGFGQYAFNDGQFMPSWGYMSYELRPWLIYPTAPWPAVFSVYPRLGAETGVIGLICWVVLWLGLSVRTVRASQAFTMRVGRVPVLAYPLVMNFIGVLIAGLANDSFRFPMIWIALGVAGSFLASLGQMARQERRPLASLEFPTAGALAPS